MDVPQRHVVEIRKDAGVHIVGAADGDLLRLGAQRPSDELVGDKHIPRGGINLHLGDGGGHRVGVGGNFGIGEVPPHMGGLDEGQHVQVHGAERVG